MFIWVFFVAAKKRNSFSFSLNKKISKNRNDHNSTPKARFSIIVGSFESSRRDLFLCSLRSRIVNVKKSKNTFKFFNFGVFFLVKYRKKEKGSYEENAVSNMTKPMCP